MLNVNAIGNTTLGATSSTTDLPRTTLEAAQQFEALLIGQLLKGMHDNGGGWLDSGEDQTGAPVLGMAEEHLARVLAAQGGLGLARQISVSLNMPSEQAAN